MESTLDLNKKIYSTKGALEKLDEEFVEFALSPLDPKEFFQLYNKYFEEIKGPLHNYFFAESQKIAYPESGYINPRQAQIDTLTDQVNQIQEEIDDVEREHPYFKNGTVICNIVFKEDIDAVLPSNTSQLYYIQSGRKRKIEDYQTYLNLKRRVTKRIGEVSNEDFINFVDSQTLNGLTNGPPIFSLQDIFIQNREINTYNQTLGVTRT